VRLLYEDEGATPLVAPGVRVLNLSIGDPSRTLDGPMSPLPRMIDCSLGDTACCFWSARER